MNDRDCENCAHHTGGSCSVWECSFEPIEDDMISRQAVIDALCGECQGNCIPCESFPCGEIKSIQALPSAQPTQTDTSNTLKALDCVERQAAIDALIEWYGCEPNDIDAFKEIIYNKPSAQPEITHCRECRYKMLDASGDEWICSHPSIYILWDY